MATMSTAEARPLVSADRWTTYSLTVLGICILGFAFDIYEGTIIQLATPLLIKDWGITPATIGYISTVMVHPDYRNKGIATKLVRGAVDYIHGRGMERAILDVVSTNDPAVKVYTRIGFRAFEEVVQLIGETGSLSLQEGGVETRPYVGGDLDDAYDLIMASDEQGHLRAYDFTKKQLEIPFWVRLFHIATQVRFVAVREGKAVGYISASYTTPKEAGIMGTSRVRPADRSQGIELALIRAVVGELKRGGIEKIRMGVPTTRPELLEMARSLGMRDAMTMVGMCTT